MDDNGIASVAYAWDQRGNGRKLKAPAGSRTSTTPAARTGLPSSATTARRISAPLFVGADVTAGR